MRVVAHPIDKPCEDSEAFVAELSRLEREINEVNQQLDRLEVELRDALGELARERFEGYR